MTNQVTSHGALLKFKLKYSYQTSGTLQTDTSVDTQTNIQNEKTHIHSKKREYKHWTNLRSWSPTNILFFLDVPNVCRNKKNNFSIYMLTYRVCSFSLKESKSHLIFLTKRSHFAGLSCYKHTLSTVCICVYVAFPGFDTCTQTHTIFHTHTHARTHMHTQIWSDTSVCVFSGWLTDMTSRTIENQMGESERDCWTHRIWTCSLIAPQASPYIHPSIDRPPLRSPVVGVIRLVVHHQLIVHKVEAVGLRLVRVQDHLSDCERAQNKHITAVRALAPQRTRHKKDKYWVC